MFSRVWESIIELFSLNPLASICLLIGVLLLLFGMLGEAEIGGVLKFSVDKASRKTSLFIAIVLIVTGLILIVRPSIQPAFITKTPLLVNELHEAAIVWDYQTAIETINKLQASNNECEQILGAWVGYWLGRKGEAALNEINAMQIDIQQQYPNCEYPMIDHPDQTVLQ